MQFLWIYIISIIILCIVLNKYIKYLVKYKYKSIYTTDIAPTLNLINNFQIHFNQNKYGSLPICI